MKPALLAVEVIVAALPSAVLASVGFLVFLYSGLSMLSYNLISGLQGIIFAIGIVFALLQYGRLALSTVLGKLYRFDWEFWLAVPFACYAVHLTFGFGLRAALFIACPILLSTLHLVILQMRIRGASSASTHVASTKQ